MTASPCSHRPFRPIYKAINLHLHFLDEGREFVCSTCGKTCKITREGVKERRSFSLKRYLTYFLRMLPALIFIVVFVYGILPARGAIVLTIVYHLIAMWCIIKYSPKLKISTIA